MVPMYAPFLTVTVGSVGLNTLIGTLFKSALSMSMTVRPIIAPDSSILLSLTDSIIPSPTASDGFFTFPDMMVSCLGGIVTVLLTDTLQHNLFPSVSRQGIVSCPIWSWRFWTLMMLPVCSRKSIPNKVSSLILAICTSILTVADPTLISTTADPSACRCDPSACNMVSTTGFNSGLSEVGIW